MVSEFDQLWLADSATYLDDVLWPAVVRLSDANAGHTERHVQAAWAAYCEFESSDPDYQALIAFIEAAEDAKIDSEAVSKLIADHRGLYDLVAAVDDAIADVDAEDDDDDEDEDEDEVEEDES